MRPPHWSYLLIPPAIASCVPLESLDNYAQGSSDSVAPASGGALSSPRTECGNGTIEDGEECDTAGASPGCSADCRIVRCPEGCDCDSLETINLAVCGEVVPFEVAKAKCEEFGWKFGAPQSADEGRALRELISRATPNDTWIDATDAEEEGVWLTSLGDVLWRGEVGGQLEGPYAAWTMGEPGNAGGEEDCAASGVDGRWTARECSEPLAFFCTTRSEPTDSCGNGEDDPGEYCDDDGEFSESCDSDCTLPYCGDGLANEAAGEECDDGNTNDNDVCDSECRRTGLLAHWPLSEVAGTVAHDVASHEYDGDLLGAQFSSDVPGVLFNGIDQAIVVSADRALMVEGQLTMMAQIHTKGSTLSGSDRDTILANTNGVDRENWLRLRGDSLVGGAWQPERQDSALASVPQLWSEDVEQHVAVRYDGSSWALFHEGRLVQTEPRDQGAYSIPWTWSIGGRPDLKGRYFDGLIRDVRLYEVALSDEAIRAISELEP